MKSKKKKKQSIEKNKINFVKAFLEFFYQSWMDSD